MVTNAPTDAGGAILPFWLQRQCDPSSTSFVSGGGGTPSTNTSQRDWLMIGTLGRPERAVVDGRGAVTPWEGAWSLDWWVGAEDRWYLPAREVTVRQRLVDDTPVVETALRIRGGDIDQRVFAITGDDGTPWTIVEIYNRSAAAVAVAAVVRPWGPQGAAHVGEVDCRGEWLIVNGRPAVALPQSPWRTYGATAADPDGVAGAVLAGVDSTLDGPLTCPDGAAQVAAVVPLPHTLMLRFAVPMEAPVERGRARRALSGAVPEPPATPSASVVAGWHSQSARGVRVELPDATIAHVLAAGRCHQLVAAAGEDLVEWPLGGVDLSDWARVLGGLDAWGCHDEVAGVLASWEERQALDGRFLGNDRRRDTTGAALVALDHHVRTTGDPSMAMRLTGVVAKAATWIDRRAASRRHRADPATLGLVPDGDPPPWLGVEGPLLTYHDQWWSLAGLDAAARLLERAGEPNAAAEARRCSGRLRGALDAALASDAAGGATTLPVGPRQGSGPGATGVLDAVLLGVVDPHDERVGATLAELARIASVGDAVTVNDPRRGPGPLGVSASLTARVARVELARGDDAGVTRLRWLAGAATPAVTWPTVAHPLTGNGIEGAGHDHVANADVLLAVRDLLVIDRTPGVVALGPVVPESWLGQSWEVHGLPTVAGRLSYAVRWHGDRAAVLWEIDGDPAASPPQIRIPGLDPAWTAATWSGEALVGPVARPESRAEPPAEGGEFT